MAKAIPFQRAARYPEDSLKTRIGELEFEHGFPANRETVATLYDEMDFQRACQAYLWAVPAGCPGL